MSDPTIATVVIAIMFATYFIHFGVLIQGAMEDADRIVTGTRHGSRLPMGYRAMILWIVAFSRIPFAVVLLCLVLGVLLALGDAANSPLVRWLARAAAIVSGGAAAFTALLGATWFLHLRAQLRRSIHDSP